jgi:fatty acid desaturase
MFKNNVGTIDRVIRAVIGIAALVAFFMLPEAGWRWWLLIGIVPLATSLIGSCPIYSILGLSTCPLKRT